LTRTEIVKLQMDFKPVKKSYDEVFVKMQEFQANKANTMDYITKIAQNK